MREPILAVDFGTSSTSAALVQADAVTLLKEPATGAWSWPSSVFLDGERLVVGTLAERKKRLRPACYRAELKRDLGEDALVVLGERAFAVVDLVAVTLTALREEAERVHGRPVTRAVLTIPAGYTAGDPRRSVLLDAARRAGLTPAELLSEPVAAALSDPAGAPFAPGDVVLVYDLGGGTFDTALVRVTDGGHELLGHAALDDCGGRDLDAAVVGWLREQGGIEPAAATTLAARRAQVELAELARAMKHQLSAAEVAEEVFVLTGAEVTLTRADFAALAMPILRRTLKLSRELLVGAPPITAVLVTGASSRMPLIFETVTGEFGAARRSADPDLAVVRGAARFAAGAADRALTSLPRRTDDPAMRWPLPDGGATLVELLITPGTTVTEGDPVALVRPADGSLWQLRSGYDAEVAEVAVAPGAHFVAGDPMLTRIDRFRPWRTPVPGTVAGDVAAGGGGVFVVAERNRRYTLHAFLAITGEPRWHHELAAQPKLAPVVHAGLVLVQADGRRLDALRAGTGERAWSVEVPDTPRWQRNAITHVAAEHGLVAVADRFGARLFGAADGVQRWACLPAGHYGEDGASVAIGPGTTCVVLHPPAAQQQRLIALDTASGEVRWERELGLWGSIWRPDPPVVHGDLVVYKSAQPVSAYPADPPPGSGVRRSVWRRYLPLLATRGRASVFRLSDGELLWWYRDVDAEDRPVLVAGDLVIAGNGGSNGSTHINRAGLAARDGRVVWSSTRMPGALVAAGGSLYQVDNGDVVARDSGTGVERWRHKGPATYQSGRSSLAASGDAVFVHAFTDAIAAFDGRTGAAPER